MTESQKQAQETRRRNKAAQEARQKEYWAQEAIDKPLMLDALRAVLRNPNSTPEQLIFAVSVLDSVKCYHVIPVRLEYPGKANMSTFKNELNKITGGDATEGKEG